MQTWVEEELATADLGDKRLNERFRIILDGMSQKPSLKFPAIFNGCTEVNCGYDFLDNKKVDEAKVFSPHRAATVERVGAYPVVIVAQDTTEIDVTRAHERMEGAGPLNESTRLGFYDHVMLAMTPEGLPLGIVHAHVWARDAEDFAKDAGQKREERKAKRIEEKESHRWLEGYRQACTLADEVPKTMIVCVSDSEGDIYECIQEGQAPAAEDKRKAEWIIRACQNRQLKGPDGAPVEEPVAAKLLERVAATPVLERITVEVSRRVPKSKDERKRKQPRSARSAVLAVRAVRVKPQAPHRAGVKLADVEVNAVLLREIEPPDGEEAIEWLLLTSLAIGTMEEVHRVIEYYCCRWQIEIYFRILKSGCKVEESQLEKASRFRPYLALCMIVAWRVMYVMMLGRECPELPCDVAFDDEEWRAVYAVVKNEAPPKEPPSLGEMVVLIAMLGGYMNRKGDGEPGPKAMWVGMQRMTDLGLAWRAFARHGPAELAKKIKR
jgi:hypothetical protein